MLNHVQAVAELFVQGHVLLLSWRGRTLQGNKCTDTTHSVRNVS